MAKSESRTTELRDTVSDIYDLVQEAGTTRADMQTALDSIADLCTDALPELDESSNDEDTEAED